MQLSVMDVLFGVHNLFCIPITNIVQMRARFRTDTRGVSEVVGAVLLLGILMLTLSIYQVTVIPNQNAAAEFEHNQQAEDELVDVRNAILEARSSGENTFASMTLGAQYQNRLLTINPPPPSGTLQTVEQRNISVTETDGETRPDPLRLDERPLESQFLEYSPRYYEYDQAGTMRFENTVAYHDYDSSNVFLTDQTLVRGDTVSLVPLGGTFRKDGTGRVAVEPMPGVLETVSVDDPEITVPTNLSEDDWIGLLDGEVDESNIDVTDGDLTLTLEGDYDVAYAPVGLNRVPNEGERGNDDDGINPAAPGDVQLVGADWSRSTVELTFRNSADETTFTDGRINFYTGTGQIPTKATAINVTGGANNPRGSNWQISDDFADLDPNIELEGNGATTSVDFVFDEGVNENQDFFIVTLTLESGQQATYFVGGSFSFDGGGGGGGPVVGDPGTAFDDANNNNQLDGGETTYEESDLYTFNDETVNLVIPEAVGTVERGNQINIRANSITSEVDFISNNENVRLESTGSEIISTGSEITANNNVDLISATTASIDDTTIESVTGSVTVDADDELTATGSSVTANNDITLDATGDVSLNSATVDADTGQVTVRSDGAITATGVSVSANNNIVIRSDTTGDITVEGATIVSDSGQLTIETDGGLTADDSTLEAPGNILLRSTENLSADTASISSVSGTVTLQTSNALSATSTDISSTSGAITLDSGTEIDATGSEISSDTNIVFISTGDIFLDSATITTDYGSITADLGSGSATLHIDRTTVTGDTIDYSPNGVTEDPERAIAS